MKRKTELFLKVNWENDVTYRCQVSCFFVDTGNKGERIEGGFETRQTQVTVLTNLS